MSLLINNYIEQNKLSKDPRWSVVMPVVRKIGEDLINYWKHDVGDTEAWALQTNIEFFVVNVQYKKLEQAIEKAISYLNRKQHGKDNLPELRTN